MSIPPVAASSARRSAPGSSPSNTGTASTSVSISAAGALLTSNVGTSAIENIQ